MADQEGNTPLHVAALSSKTECLRVLLRAGGTDGLNIGESIRRLIVISITQLVRP